jgi:hypothetical protein
MRLRQPRSRGGAYSGRSGRVPPCFRSPSACHPGDLRRRPHARSAGCGGRYRDRSPGQPFESFRSLTSSEASVWCAVPFAERPGRGYGSTWRPSPRPSGRDLRWIVPGCRRSPTTTSLPPLISDSRRRARTAPASSRSAAPSPPARRSSMGGAARCCLGCSTRTATRGGDIRAGAAVRCHDRAGDAGHQHRAQPRAHHRERRRRRHPLGRVRHHPARRAPQRPVPGGIPPRRRTGRRPPTRGHPPRRRPCLGRRMRASPHAVVHHTRGGGRPHPEAHRGGFGLHQIHDRRQYRRRPPRSAHFSTRRR